jgi:hypothetical protein
MGHSPLIIECVRSGSPPDPKIANIAYNTILRLTRTILSRAETDPQGLFKTVPPKEFGFEDSRATEGMNFGRSLFITDYTVIQMSKY